MSLIERQIFDESGRVTSFSSRMDLGGAFLAFFMAVSAGIIGTGSSYLHLKSARDAKRRDQGLNLLLVLAIVLLAGQAALQAAEQRVSTSCPARASKTKRLPRHEAAEPTVPTKMHRSKKHHRSDDTGETPSKMHGSKKHHSGETTGSASSHKVHQKHHSHDPAKAYEPARSHKVHHAHDTLEAMEPARFPSKRQSMLLNLSLLFVSLALAIRNDKEGLPGLAKSLLRFFLFPGPIICKQITEWMDTTSKDDDEESSSSSESQDGSC